MDEAAKRRLAGAAVLVALVVIFVPMLVEEREPSGLGDPILVPAPPDFDSRLDPAVTAPPPQDAVLPLPTPEPPGGPPGELIPEPAITAPDPAPVAAPDADAQTAPGPQPVPPGAKSWVVQVASVGSMDGAKKMQDELRAKGYPAFVEEAVVNGKTYFRVRVGPEVERKRADGVAKRIEGATGKKPIVQSYP